MASLTFFNRCFTFQWRMLFLAVLGIGLFMRLGIWQLGRAEEKEHMRRSFHHFAKQPAFLWEEGMTLPKPYQRVVVTGTFLRRTLLFDNQHYQHQFGYQVITPLQLDSGKLVLVNRGWVAADKMRQTWPNPTTPRKRQRLIGHVYYPQKNWTLGPLFEEKKADLTLIESLDLPLISQFLHQSIYPFMIRLDEKEPYCYRCEWEVVSLSPKRHQAYAIQWFAMALVVFILFVVLNIK